MGDLGVLAAFVIARLCGHFGVAVCGKMLSGVWALSAYYDQIICAELFSSP